MSDSASDVVIVGAGPYGLSVGAHLQNLGLEVRVIGTPMQFWASAMPEGMFLKSEPFASSLGAPQDGMRFTDRHPGWRTGQPIPLDTFVDYGRWFAAEAVPSTEPGEVVKVERGGSTGYTVTLATGESIASRVVVLAVGVGPFAHVPDELASLPSWLVSHSSAHRDLGLFAGEEVAVVGSGQSALETAVLLADAGARPRLIARREELDWNTVPKERRSLADRLFGGPQSGLGTGYRTWLWSQRPGVVRHLPHRMRRRIVRTTLPPAGSWWLRERLDERVTVTTGTRVTRAAERDEGVALTLDDGSGRETTAEVRHVIAATGYVPDVARLGMLSPELRVRVDTRAGSPVLTGDFESSLPGLYFAGLAAAATFGPVMRFVHGSDFAARRIAGSIIRRTPPGGGLGRRADGALEAGHGRT
ncbi:NAD(P)/FAD-dependent oxidoreductase [Actinomadura fibrosa]|uniref:NAD(P)/FAD-dependent oxidoreductase n=1 Tax=Actinomadura fibrosa TaxID=111802 RepID=A0ABW2XCV5_9ACTN|nr:NAD(P)-binding domain-containing protein [Actinomadura fibrosa]